MIDTIVLTLNKDMFQITHPDRFTPSAAWVISNINGIQSKQNPTKKELKLGIYKPRLTLSNILNHLRIYEPMLKIELSLPKLLFGNNFNELQYKDFNLVVKKLEVILGEMGVKTSVDVLARAQVATVHYSKNIPFTDGTIPYHYINKIKEANIKLSLDVNQTDYRNEGHCYKWHCNSYEIVFYDKIKDLEQAKKSNKRALEKDSDLQINFLKTFKNRKNLEFLRMEVRLNKRQKIKQLFKKLNIKSDLNFKKLFKPAISKKILLHYLEEIENNCLDYKVKDDKTLLSSIIINNPNISVKKVFQIFGLRKALEFSNLRELRTMLANNKLRSLNRLISEIKKLNLDRKHSSLYILREKLYKFKPIIF